jgi:ethanolamine utilization protein EutN
VKLARVVGTVVSTVKSPIFDGRAMLLVDLLEPDGREAGGYLIAVDTVGAGAGETVLVLDEGTSARQIVGAAHGPLRTVIVGIVDAVEGPAGVGREPVAAVAPVTRERPKRSRRAATGR